MVTTIEQQVDVNTQVPTIEEITAAMDETWERLEALLSGFAPAFEAGEDAGGWDPRHLLSHLVGSWQRVPVHSAFFFGHFRGQKVPIQLHNDYWIGEWESAPLEAFVLAMKAAYLGNRQFVRDLDPSALHLTAMTTFGEMTLGELLITSYKSHIGDFHTPQLAAFLRG